MNYSNKTHKMTARSAAMLAAALCGIGLITGPVLADTSLNYQGYVQFDGQALNQPADLVFTLWNAPTGGAQLGPTLTVPALAVDNGLVSTTLDFGLEPFEDGDERWLQVEIAAPAGVGALETLTPRRPLSAVPLALHALSGVEGPAGPTMFCSNRVTSLAIGCSHRFAVGLRSGYSMRRQGAILHIVQWFA